MVIDYEYLKELLAKFEESETVLFPVTNLLSTCPYDEKLIFHIMILTDYKCIQHYQTYDLVAKETTSTNISLDYSHVSDNASLRLTAQGYEFSSILKQKEFWEVFKTDLKNNSLETLWNAGKDLASGLLKAKVGKFIDDNHS